MNLEQLPFEDVRIDHQTIFFSIGTIQYQLNARNRYPFSVWHINEPKQRCLFCEGTEYVCKYFTTRIDDLYTLLTQHPNVRLRFLTFST